MITNIEDYLKKNNFFRKNNPENKINKINDPMMATPPDILNILDELYSKLENRIRKAEEQIYNLNEKEEYINNKAKSSKTYEDKKVIDYKLIELQCAKAFRESISFQLKKKYQPYGKPYIGENVFRQIWVKYEGD